MDEPIINPWVFYYIDTLSSLSCLFSILTLVSILCFIINWSCLGDEIANIEFERKCGIEREVTQKRTTAYIVWVKRLATAIFVFGFLSIILPSKDTMYKMLIAQYTTKQNAQNGVEFVIDVVDKAIEKFNLKKQ